MNEQSDPTLDRYLNGDYAEKNPDWDSADSSWKADKLAEFLAEHNVNPGSIVEVGCGSGAVLAALRKYFPDTSLSGFDIAPDAKRFWKDESLNGIHFELADYLVQDGPVPDLVLLIDVLELIGNPWEFLAHLRRRSKLIAIHFPLDLSALSVLRERPLLNVREKVGHLHYFTRGLALSLLEESGYEIVAAQYTGASLNAPQRSLRTKIAGVVRWLLYLINHDLGARLLGGETLLVLARPRGPA